MLRTSGPSSNWARGEAARSLRGGKNRNQVPVSVFAAFFTAVIIMMHLLLWSEQRWYIDKE